MEPDVGALSIDHHSRSVEWWLDNATEAASISVPWGEIRLGQETGEGLEVWVKVDSPFTLILHSQTTTFYEPLETGQHRILLTVLDRSDVR